MTDRRKDEAAIIDLVNSERGRMTLTERRLWDTIAIPVEQWIYQPRPDLQSIAWVVAIIGSKVIWYDDYYNEMTDGFYVCDYARHGDLAAGATGNDGTLSGAVNVFLGHIKGIT